jgi:hypothetical protein
MDDHDRQTADVRAAVDNLGLGGCVLEVVTGCREDNAVVLMFRNQDLNVLQGIRSDTRNDLALLTRCRDYIAEHETGDSSAAELEGGLSELIRRLS